MRAAHWHIGGSESKHRVHLRRDRCQNTRDVYLFFYRIPGKALSPYHGVWASNYVHNYPAEHCEKENIAGCVRSAADPRAEQQVAIARHTSPGARSRDGD